MLLTLADITPVGLCIATQDLFDAKRYQTNFCDTILLRGKDKDLEPHIVKIKRELNSSIGEKKFLEGHKAAILNNIDKIVGLVASRYAYLDIKLVESIVLNSKTIIEKIFEAKSFAEIAILEPEFKKNITLPVYELFLSSVKRSQG